MQITEVRNDILKMTYSPYQNGVLLSDFVLVSEGTKSVLAQVTGLESSQEKDTNTATLKCCLSVDETGKIGTYSGFIPSTGAEVAPVSQEQVISMLANGEKSVAWGYLAQHENLMFKTEKDFLSNKLLILTDDYENYKIITANLVHINKELGQKTVIVDFDGSINAENAFYVKIGEDFKLPLSCNILNYIYENDLKTENISEQAVIQDIIISLHDYIKTLDSGYLPFTDVKNVICSQYEANKIPELALLKNKFLKYSQQEFLAESDEDFNSLNAFIEENNIVIIDASALDTVWHKLLLNYISNELSTPCTFICKPENDNSDKKTIINFYNNKTINPIIISDYNNECASVMKSIAKNMILFPPIQAVSDFPTYNSFLQKLNRDEYVMCGENTLYLNFILKLAYLDSNMLPEYIEKEIRQDIDNLYKTGAKQPAIETTAEPGISEPETDDNIIKEEAQETISDFDEMMTEEDLDLLDTLTEIPEDTIPAVSETAENTEPAVNEQLQDNFTTEEEPQPEIFDSTEQEDITQVQQETETEAEAETAGETETDTEAETQTESEPPVEEFLPEADENIESAEIIEPVDNIMLQKEIKPEKPIAEEQPVKPIEIPIPPSQPIPVYSVPELEVETPADFKEGNLVYHEKYGKGVIEKIMNYGKKTLCSIQFDDVGRRLLDPNLAGLKQL